MTIVTEKETEAREVIKESDGNNTSQVIIAEKN